ncbi:tight adherence protein F [Enterobacter asburiae]|uniref:tight adherence pilus pseudopilin TadF n=1 Tax=Enterobacter asburiae TaxID=61645 RepID=UPI00141B1498|nr:tight adherence pilus pseudopilin TadF [Enterobacter asburiae]NIH92221.1 tight adherence protein F [Enterobacter asburiae]
MNVRNLWTNRQGSIAVESAIISVVLLIFMFFLADLVIRQATVGKLDRLSYSVAGILRERTQLYASREELSQNDVNRIYRLAQRMLQDMDPTANTSSLKIRVQQLFFVPRADLSNNEKIPVNKPDRTHNIQGGECQPAKSLNKLQELSPRGSYGRWVPMYQVTLCLPTVSWYQKLTSGDNRKPLMASSSIVMLR